MSSTSHSLVGVSVCDGRYRLTQRLGAGSFGEIYKSTDTQTNHIVAVKLEKAKSPHPQLLSELRFYSFLLQGASGPNGCKSVKSFIPNVYQYTTEGEYNILVMDMLSSSLESLFDSCNNRFSLKATLMLAEQMISALEYIHSRYILHRDIKPDNFMMGAGRKVHHVYVIDFGLAKRYRVPKTNAHIPYKDGKSLTGTARYCSINTHLGIEQSRRDDLEGVGYILVYFLQGTLPWQGLKATNKDAKYALIARKKMATPVEELCAGLPIEFASYINYVRALEFEEKPDYGYLKALFHNLFHRLGYQRDFVYDWTLRKIQERVVAQEKILREKAPLTGSATGARTGAKEALTYAAASPV